MVLLDDFFDNSDDNYIMKHMYDTVTMAGYVMGQFRRRARVPKLTGLVENVVPQYSLQDFCVHFRISRAIFDHILQEIFPALMVEAAGGREPISLEKTVTGLHLLHGSAAVHEGSCS